MIEKNGATGYFVLLQEKGMHLRPAILLGNCIQELSKEYGVRVYIQHEGQDYLIDHPKDVIMIALLPGSQIVIKVLGAEKKICQKVLGKIIYCLEEQQNAQF